MNKPALGTGSLTLVGLLFIGIILLANTLLRGAQIDLTQDRLFTLSDGTRNILRDLKEPVNLYLFSSDSTATPIPDLKVYGTRVRELLESMVARSNGKLTLKVIDPQPFSEEEDRATELGVQGMASTTTTACTHQRPNHWGIAPRASPCFPAMARLM